MVRTAVWVTGPGTCRARVFPARRLIGLPGL